MTLKKLVIILISVFSALLVSVLTIFFVSNANKTIYATSLTASVEQIDLTVGEECFIFDKISFDIKPANCTQSLKFSVDDISTCSIETSKRNLKARKAGTAILTVSVKSSSSKYLSVQITINIVDDIDTNIYASQITKLKDNIMMSVGDEIDVDNIFSVYPENHNQNVLITFDNNLVEYENGKITSLGAGTTNMTIKILKNAEEYLEANLAIRSFNSAENFEFDKNIEFVENADNIVSLYVSTDIPALAELGKIDFDYTYDSQKLQLVEIEINTFKIKCLKIGNFDFTLSNAGYNIVYHLNITPKFDVLAVTTQTSYINLELGSEFDLNDIVFENMSADCNVAFNVSNQNASINSNKLVANNIGNCQLVATITYKTDSKNINIPVNITKRNVEYQKSVLLSSETLTINLFEDEFVSQLSPIFDLSNIIFDSEMIAVENFANPYLTISLLKTGQTELSISCDNVEIIVKVTIE